MKGGCRRHLRGFLPDSRHVKSNLARTLQQYGTLVELPGPHHIAVHALDGIIRQAQRPVLEDLSD
ncbi:hypothetical protein D3C76_1635950 [compost metagenome]